MMSISFILFLSNILLNNMGRVVLDNIEVRIGHIVEADYNTAGKKFKFNFSLFEFLAS